MLDRDTINELNILSVAVFGTKSKWKKMCDLGVMEPVMEETKKLTIENGEEVAKMVKAQKVDDNGIAVSTMRHYTPETVKEFMLMVLDRRKQMQDTINRLEAEKKAQSAAKATAQAASGTAV